MNGARKTRSATQEDLIRAVMAQGIHDARLLQALRDVPKATYVPLRMRTRAYEDEPLPIPRGQVTTQPRSCT